MKLHDAAWCGAVLFLSTTSADAAVINLIDRGGVAGTPVGRVTSIAALYWGAMLTNNVTINLEISLSPAVIGVTDVSRRAYSLLDWERQLRATRSGSALDQTAILPALDAEGGAKFITNGKAADGSIDTNVRSFVSGDTTSNRVLSVNTAVLKAVGAINATDPLIDGAVAFNSGADLFDFDPTDGIGGAMVDFLAVAIHEIGHALGFVSGVDTLDQNGLPNGPGAGPPGYDLDGSPTFSPLDMFRYSTDPSDLVGGQPVLDLSVGTQTYFSIDGGANPLFGSADFSTGGYNGDGNQASHWRDTVGDGSFAQACGKQLGIMDPVICQGQAGEVTALDLAAFDAMGWNTSLDVVKYPDYLGTTADIYRQFRTAVPEPTTWAMMLIGLAMVGGALRGGQSRGREDAGSRPRRPTRSATSAFFGWVRQHHRTGLRAA